MISPRLIPDKSESRAEISADSSPQTSLKIVRAKRTSTLPATLAQRRFWLLDKLKAGGNPTLNMPLPMRLRGPLDYGALGRALNEVVTRHEALRTTLISERGELRQLISPQISLDLPIMEASDQPTDRLLREEAARPFDLTAGPLVRARLVRVDDADHLLLLTVHHIISDGWSNGVLVRELWALYGAFVENKSSSLPELRMQFADYADLQQTRLASDDFARQREYWRTQLAGDPPVLNLPVDHPRPRAHTGAGDRCTRVLAPELVCAAKIFAAREGTTPFMFFLSLFQVLLHRYTGQTDFLVTSPSANRQRQEFEPLIGLFVNPLLLRADLRGDPSFRELLTRVRRIALNAFDNQDMPFELLLDEFDSSRLQVNFLYQSAFVEKMTLLGGLSVEPLNCPNLGIVYELNASIFEDATGARLELEYDAALFDPETIDRALDHFETLLAGALAEPTKAISTLPLTKGEKLQRLESAATIPISQTLCEHAGLVTGESVASFTEPGVAVEEERGAILMGGARLISPPAGLLGETPAVLAEWLETQDIAMVFMPATSWHRLGAAFGRKIVKPAKLRHVMATEGAPNEGGFGRVSANQKNGIHVSSRTVLEGIGTIAINGEAVPSVFRTCVVDQRSHEPLPIGVIGELVAISNGETRKTGELARRLRDGSLERFGHPNEQIYARGLRLDLRHIEKALQQVPGIAHALIRAYPQSGARLIGYILPQPGAAPLPNDAALRQLLREGNLPDELIPTAFVRLKDVPVRASDGRFDLGALPAPPREPTEASEFVPPYLGLQLELIAIWKDVLKLPDVGIRDDFFDLGGNSLLAMRMLQRAELSCGKEILPAALFRCATIEHLASEIAGDVIRDSRALVRVNDAGNRTPFFYLHGDLFGGGLYSLKLSRALGLEQPLYVLPPHDVRLLAAPPSIEEMAAAHLCALRSVQPEGPYIIGGFCIGGIVAYELAQQIVASGDEVEMLLIIDATSEDKSLRVLRSLAQKIGAIAGWDEDAKVAHFGKWAAWHARLERWSGLNRQKQIRIALRRLYNRFLCIFSAMLPRATKAAREEPGHQAPRERDVFATFLWASAGYRPQPYHFPVALLLSEEVLPETTLASNWLRLAPNIAIHPLRGRHLECITNHVDILADKIKICLQQNAGIAASK